MWELESITRLDIEELLEQAKNKLEKLHALKDSQIRHQENKDLKLERTDKRTQNYELRGEYADALRFLTYALETLKRIQ